MIYVAYGEKLSEYETTKYLENAKNTATQLTLEVSKEKNLHWNLDLHSEVLKEQNIYFTQNTVIEKKQFVNRN